METNNVCTCRIFSTKNIAKFQDKLSEVDWCEVLAYNKCQDAFNVFYEVYCKTYEDSFPIVKIKSGYKNRKPWLTSGLKNSIKIKNKFYVKSIKRPTSDNIKQYKQYRNTLHKILRISERDHYKFLLNINKIIWLNNGALSKML